MPTYILRDLPPELWDRVKVRAALEGRPLRALLLELLRRYADHGLSDGAGKSSGSQPTPKR